MPIETAIRIDLQELEAQVRALLETRRRVVSRGGAAEIEELRRAAREKTLLSQAEFLRNELAAAMGAMFAVTKRGEWDAAARHGVEVSTLRRLLDQVYDALLVDELGVEVGVRRAA